MFTPPYVGKTAIITCPDDAMHGKSGMVLGANHDGDYILLVEGRYELCELTFTPEEIRILP